MLVENYVEIEKGLSSLEYPCIKDQLICEWLFYDQAYGIRIERTLYEPRTDFLFNLKLQHFGTVYETKTKESICPNKNNN
jgi:hypothetical protein